MTVAQFTERLRTDSEFNQTVADAINTTMVYGEKLINVLSCIDDLDEETMTFLDFLKSVLEENRTLDEDIRKILIQD